jgi:cell wall-associated NlpC family hydrolase
MLKHNIRNLIIVLVITSLMSACAALRGKPPEPPDMRDEIIKTALSLRGKVYKKNGKGPDGFDCSGFVYYVYKKSNISLSPSTNKLIRYGHKITLDNVKPGDLVFFKAKKIFHVGIMLNHEEFIHSSTRKGVTIDRLDSSYWGKKSFYFRSVL